MSGERYVGERDRQRDRETERERERQTERQRQRGGEYSRAVQSRYTDTAGNVEDT